jgi:hypothetical protein
MTAFDILVPIIALAIAGAAAWYARRSTRQFDRKHGGKHHPAE